jgi:hypothetical protein
MNDNTNRDGGKSTSFRERAEQMAECARRLIALSDDALRVSGFLSQEATNMQAASERFAQQNAEKRNGRPSRFQGKETRRA